MVFYLSFLLSLSLSAIAHGHANFIVEISANSPEQRTDIANIIHIDSVEKDRVFSVVNHHDMSVLSQDKSIDIISAEIIGDNISSYYSPFVNAAEFPRGDEKFHTYDEVTEALNDMAGEHPHLATVFSVGKSIEDRDIWAIRISDDSEITDSKKAIVFMGTHHAREHVSTEVPIRHAQKLLAQYTTDDHIKELLKEVEIFVIPLVNPDGAIYDIKNGRYKWWRKNRRENYNGSFGVDLNRNYGYGWGTGGSSTSPNSDVYMGKEAFSEPETKNIKNFFEARDNITIAVSFHTYSELILYPWGGSNEHIGGEDEKIFKTMAEKMAKMNDYTPMQSSDLYVASGDTCDWLYGEQHVYCFTFELSPSSFFGGGFYPGASIIDDVVNDNYDPIIYLIEHTKDPSLVLQ